MGEQENKFQIDDSVSKKRIATLSGSKKLRHRVERKKGSLYLRADFFSLIIW